LNISATILAAGSSKRMEGANKLLLLYKGETLIKRISQNLINSNLDPVFIVTGFEHKKILKTLPTSLNNIIHNKNWSMGISKSINIAISSLPSHIDGNMFILGDMPLITVKTLNKLKSAFKMKNGKKIIYAEYLGNQANPVIFPKSYFEQILLLKGDSGCKEIISKNKEESIGVPINSSEVIFDCDTKDDYDDLVSNMVIDV
tara:strand:- start:857 stop:1462 length:606 start_codon:yes stop_codon:yes gene_type:complete